MNKDQFPPTKNPSHQMHQNVLREANGEVLEEKTTKKSTIYDFPEQDVKEEDPNEPFIMP